MTPHIAAELGLEDYTGSDERPISTEGWMSVIFPQTGLIMSHAVETPPDLKTMQKMVGGLVEMVVDMKTVTKPSVRIQFFVNEEGLMHTKCQPNVKATAWLVAHCGLMIPNLIRGPAVILSGRKAVWK